MEENKDVDLYAELDKVLNESEAEETSVASDQEPTTETETVETPTSQETDELSEEEISQLSPRAQKRIRDLASKVKELAEKSADTSPEETPETEPEEHDFKNVQDFLQAVEDEPSRRLLEKFHKVIKSELKETLSPIEKANAEAKFEEEFKKYEKIEGIADYKNDIKKTFMRNPSQSVKALVGEVVTDIQIARVKPIEKTPSNPNRAGKPDLDSLSKDDLYAQLENMRVN